MKVFDARYGWGVVVEETAAHVLVRFDAEPEYLREYLKRNGEDRQLRR